MIRPYREMKSYELEVVESKKKMDWQFERAAHGFCENNSNHCRFKGIGSTLMNQFPDLKAKDFPAKLKKKEKNKVAILIDCCKWTYYASKDAKLQLRDMFYFQGRQLTRYFFLPKYKHIFLQLFQERQNIFKFIFCIHELERYLKYLSFCNYLMTIILQIIM